MKRDFHDEFATWPVVYSFYGGINSGEIIGVAQAVGDDAWIAAGDRFAQ